MSKPKHNNWVEQRRIYAENLVFYTYNTKMSEGLCSHSITRRSASADKTNMLEEECWLMFFCPLCGTKKCLACNGLKQTFFGILAYTNPPGIFEQAVSCCKQIAFHITGLLILVIDPEDLIILLLTTWPLLLLCCINISFQVLTQASFVPINNLFVGHILDHVCFLCRLYNPAEISLQIIRPCLFPL